jgi:alanyl-tRNA synthetase
MPLDRFAWPAPKVRSVFIRHFELDTEDPHVFWKSSPVVPYNDETLLFANSGMVQFKPIFLGIADPGSPLYSVRRACNSQKCIRAGGKHNDLDDVGKDTYHHTFFEMLGNWSFGDYFKAAAIEKAFKLLTEVYGLSPDRLYATYFEGDESLGLAPDLEAKELWLKCLPESHVLPGDKKDNFWEMGDTGPCGPCSELHYDRMGGRNAANLVNMDDPMVIEIWNLVFMQFNREPSGELRPLPNKHVDTGMGFERLVSILQDQPSNYDTDVFAGIFDAIVKITVCAPYRGLVGEEDVTVNDMSMRVCADHIRTLAVAIADGAMPSAEGRGYVLRRILRRAVRYGHQYLGAESGFLTGLVPAVVESLSDAFPEVRERQAHVANVIEQEEKTFARTLQAGVKRFETIVAAAEASGVNVICGSDTFFLYDTMGFPLDLTVLMAEEKGLTVDTESFEKLLEEAKEKSRADRSSRSAGEDGVRLVLEAEETSFLSKAGIQPTVDEPKYLRKNSKAVVQNIFIGRSTGSSWVSSSSEVPTGSTFGVITDVSSFYAESGGQVADKGFFQTDAGESVFEVLDAQVAGGYVLHIGKPVAGAAPFSVGDAVSTCVDYEYRAKIAPNHTLTHVLNHALREVVGDGADQKGSIVDAAKLRFDFSHNKALSIEEMDAVEQRCRQAIKEGRVVSSLVVPLEKAKEIFGLRAVFGEVYPDPVRVVSVGASVEGLLADPKNSEWRNASIEFCGGTHIDNTKEAKAFVLLEEGSVATGIRRVVGVTGDLAAEALVLADDLQARVSSASGLPDGELGPVVTSLTAVVNEAQIPAVVKTSLRTEIAALCKRHNEAFKLKAKAAQKASSEAAMAKVEEAKTSGESRCVALVSLGGDGKALSKLVTEMSKAWPEGSVMAVTVDETKSMVKVGSASSTIPANTWVAAALECIGGKGGGKPKAGSGSGTLENLDAVSKVVAAAEAWSPES